MPILALLVLCVPWISAREIPSRPSSGIHDDAVLIVPEDRRRIQQIQAGTLDAYGVAIEVATIERLSHYTGKTTSIEKFARTWFDRWQIGDARTNKGMLLLVSHGDRKARIELGAGWGRGQDGRCQRIMREKILPDFKSGLYSRGIVTGVEELSRLAAGEPMDGDPAEGRLPAWAPLTDFLHYTTPVPPVAAVLAGLAGLLLALVGLMAPRGSKAGWIKLGLGLFALFVLLYVVLGVALLALCFWMDSGSGYRRGSSDWGGSSDGGGFSGGGFSGGGFSGGGGASGSW